VFVDNASGDGTPERLEGAEGVRLVRSPENLGYGGGCNLGAENASGELLLFMNPDVGLHPDTIPLLVRDLRGTPGAGIAFATMLEHGEPHERCPRVEDVAAMNAATMLVERSHFERLGGFDQHIFLYSEDTDICYRSWLLGGRVLKSWESVADHDVSGSGGGHRWSAEQIKNGLYVHIKLRSWPATIRYAGRMLVKTVVRGVGARDPEVLKAWVVNARELPRTLALRRALRGAASPADLALLERLGAEHDYWARVSWRRGAMHRLRGASQ
jgi:GT2 family glycosyltransferase